MTTLGRSRVDGGPVPEFGPVDCRQCGACCASGPGFRDWFGWAECTPADVQRMSRRVRTPLVALPFEPADGSPVLATPATCTDRHGKVCDFLRGVPGGRVSCRIYETRPAVCRHLVPGSADCRDARAAIGLSAAENRGAWRSARADAVRAAAAR